MLLLILMLTLALSPFIFKSRKGLYKFAIPVSAVLAFLQFDAIYGAVVGWQQATELLYVLLPHLFVVFVLMTAARALVLARFDQRSGIIWTVAIAAISLFVSFLLANYVILPLLL